MQNEVEQDRFYFGKREAIGNYSEDSRYFPPCVGLESPMGVFLKLMTEICYVAQAS